MSDNWSTWHCEKCQIVLPWKDGMENLKCVGCEMKAENARLRDQLRWRDAKTEKPQEGELCLIVMRNMIWPNVIQYSEFGSYRSPWDTDFILHWRPVGPLPGGER
jgi:hypothetical protein